MISYKGTVREKPLFGPGMWETISIYMLSLSNTLVIEGCSGLTYVCNLKLGNPCFRFKKSLNHFT
jgi:hypothetical protein